MSQSLKKIIKTKKKTKIICRVYYIQYINTWHTHSRNHIKNTHHQYKNCHEHIKQTCHEHIKQTISTVFVLITPNNAAGKGNTPHSGRSVGSDAARSRVQGRARRGESRL